VTYADAVRGERDDPDNTTAWATGDIFGVPRGDDTFATSALPSIISGYRPRPTGGVEEHAKVTEAAARVQGCYGVVSLRSTADDTDAGKVLRFLQQMPSHHAALSCVSLDEMAIMI
jgi:hypothetical protein